MPRRQYFLKAVAHEWRVNVDLGSLPDAIEASDPLFEQLRIQRQVVKHEMMRKLKISAFTSDLRAKQNTRSIFFRKPSRIPIALQQRKPFVKNRCFQIFDAHSK